MGSLTVYHLFVSSQESYIYLHRTLSSHSKYRNGGTEATAESAERASPSSSSFKMAHNWSSSSSFSSKYKPNYSLLTSLFVGPSTSTSYLGDCANSVTTYNGGSHFNYLLTHT